MVLLLRRYIPEHKARSLFAGMIIAAAMGMYPVDHFSMNAKIWMLVSYCVGTGGSLLVIGSAGQKD